MPPTASFDLVMVFFYLHRNLFPALEAALRTGGVLVYRTYTTERLHNHPNANRSFLLEPNELRDALPGLRVVTYEETVDPPEAALVALRV